MKTTSMVELSELSITTPHSPPLLRYAILTKYITALSKTDLQRSRFFKHATHHLHSILMQVNATSPFNVPSFHQLLSVKISGVATEDARFRRIREGPPLTDLSLGGAYACVASEYNRMRAREQKALEAIAGSTALALVLRHDNPCSPLELRIGLRDGVRARVTATLA